MENAMNTQESGFGTVERKVYEKPTEGLHELKIVGCELLPHEQSQFDPQGIKDRLRFRIMTDQQSADGSGPICIVKTVTKTLGKKSRLQEFLTKLKFVVPAAGSFDLDANLRNLTFAAYLENKLGQDGVTVYTEIGSVTRVDKVQQI
jgi:hypothetical protein